MRQRRVPGGIIYHYTDFKAFQSIVQDRQLRLTRFDEMQLAPDEGELTINTALDYIDNLGEKCGISSEQRESIKDAIRSHAGSTVIRRIGSEWNVECIPYVVCFTTLDMEEGESEEARAISYRDLRIRFVVEYMGLDLPYNAPETRLDCSNCFNAVEMVRMNYLDRWKDGKDEMEYDICKCLSYLSSGRYGVEDAADDIIHIVGDYRVTRLDNKYSGQEETRLIFYVPVDKERFPKVMDYVRKKKGSENTKESGDEGKYIYIDFSDEMKDLLVDFNRNNQEHTKKDYEDTLRRAGFKPYVMDLLATRQ